MAEFIFIRNSAQIDWSHVMYSVGHTKTKVCISAPVHITLVNVNSFNLTPQYMNSVDPRCCHCDRDDRNMRLLPFASWSVFLHILKYFIYPLVAYLSPTRMLLNKKGSFGVQNVSITSWDKVFTLTAVTGSAVKWLITSKKQTRCIKSRGVKTSWIWRSR